MACRAAGGAYGEPAGVACSCICVWKKAHPSASAALRHAGGTAALFVHIHVPDGAEGAYRQHRHRVVRAGLDRPLRGGANGAVEAPATCYPADPVAGHSERSGGAADCPVHPVERCRPVHPAVLQPNDADDVGRFRNDRGRGDDAAVTGGNACRKCAQRPAVSPAEVSAATDGRRVGASSTGMCGVTANWP
ncbi:hypothetical protein D9M68_622110 [compost metagenome]